jgi:hypothetical protein
MSDNNDEIINHQEELLSIMDEENQTLRELVDSMKGMLDEAKGEDK